ncbi:MAG: Serine-tRNA ligase [Candidatus Gottesmanbacteria bacterium GW2011_GWA2_44_17]|uniref:Serine--tRNA ligase n=3 Tax=Candidatus Gottesmaniibacteriota TaxID=1752720 RepID=A0A0G1HK03_9BACT
MLDINFIRQNLDICKRAAENKNRQVDWDGLMAADSRRRQLIIKIEEQRAKRNKTGKLDNEEDRRKARVLKEEVKSSEEELRIVEEKLKTYLLTIPNIPHESVPVGKDSSANVEVRKWGTPKAFDFTPKNHIQLGKDLDLIDFERGTKISGFRGYFLKNEGAHLELAVLWYSFQKLASRGFTPMIAPSLVRDFTLFGNGQLPWGKDEVYSLEKDNLYLAGTAEVPITSYFADEILKEEELPKKFVAFSPCFRREAGSYGKDTKGLYRLHQFNKVEQVVIAKNNEKESLEILEELLANAEEVLQDLELPYRVILMSTADMGEPQVKKYDIETWMPGRVSYGETMSDSFMGDFQARRLKIRYKTKDGKTVFCHTLNNTAIASPRILIAILENYQEKDGSIRVPTVLQPFVGKEVIKR